MVQASPAVTTAAKILKLLTRYRTARATLTQIAAELSLPKSTCSRILKALVDEGLLSHDTLTKMYSLGPYAIVIGSRASENVDYLDIIRNALQQLAEQTTLTAAWIQRVEPDRLMYVAKHEGTALTHVSISIGNRFPVLEVSWGQWVVAYASQAEQSEILRHGLPKVSETNITDPDKYLEHAAQSRQRGVLTTAGDYMPGIWAASAPVVTYDDKLVGILAVIGLVELLGDDARTQAEEFTREVARKIRIDHSGASTIAR